MYIELLNEPDISNTTFVLQEGITQCSQKNLISVKFHFYFRT